jgi:hypothetical protein
MPQQQSPLHHPERRAWVVQRLHRYSEPPPLRLRLSELPRSMPQGPPGSSDLDAEVYRMLQDDGASRRWVC